MTSRNVDSKKSSAGNKKRPASPATPLKSGKNSPAELSEDELKDVAGGCATGEHLKI